MIAELITTQAGDSIDLQRIDEDLYNAYSLCNFESISYRMDHTADGVDLYFDAAAKSWGPNYLYFGLDMEGDLDGDTLFNVELGYSREEINSRGGMWTSVVCIGSEPTISTFLY